MISFPQVGVALGMCVQATALGEQGILIRNNTLSAILIYELVGSLFTKHALGRVGGISKTYLTHLIGEKQ